jgi:hypothetical protein
MPRFLQVGFTFPGPPKIKELEGPFSTAGDWIRYSSHCWILWTDRSPQEVFTILKPYLSDHDHFLILGVNMTERNGLLPEWIWNWMNLRQQYQPNALTGVAGLTALGGQSPLGLGFPPYNPFDPKK